MRASKQLLTPGLLRPFPSQLSIGNDIVKVSRIHKLLFDKADDAAQSKFLRKLLTQAELQQFQARFPDLRNARNDAAQTQLISQHIAGRFAAKEAIIKACTWRRLHLQDVAIFRRSEASGVYGVMLDKSDHETCADPGMTASPPKLYAADDKQQTYYGQIVQVSISHEDEYATAVCIAAIEPDAGDVGGEAAARFQ